MPDAPNVDASVTLYCTFTAGEHRFGVPARSVREVHASTAITPIPGAPSAALGYANLRGNLFLVLSADLLLTNRGERQRGEPQLVVFKPDAGESFALETGAIGEMVAIAPHQISVPQTDDGAGSAIDCVTGHAKLDRELITLVDPRRLLPAAFPTTP
jgi:chemotaxis signal transduction protein